jgi:4-hydroxy-3-polyprenylbenzoate decarboxylase
MSYTGTESALLDLERKGMLVRIHEEVDPYLEMAAIHLRIHENNGPALLFEKIKGCKFRAVSNIFGHPDRYEYLFRDSINAIQKLISFRKDPVSALKNPVQNFSLGLKALNALPSKRSFSSGRFREISISDLPLITHWKDDGGAFVTLPQVYSEDPFQPGVGGSNLGMYRIQLNGNEYVKDREIGLHYQLHRGIGIHQTAANRKGAPLKVSIFVGGPPAHTVAAVMPLPEGMSELQFAGLLGSRRFRYCHVDGYCISLDADFVITGEIIPDLNKPEGPFGDHLGYYSLQHPFPVLKVHKVWAKENAIWPFTVVGRPPQEDTGFGNFIHKLTGQAIREEIPGVREVHAVDAAGVHPLLLAIGSERYTPYLKEDRPAEILTIANHILGTGQLSLAKFLFITADPSNTISTKDIKGYLSYLLERIDLSRDLHFHTQTSMDTLDYSGTGLNAGSKVVIAAYGKKKRELALQIPEKLSRLEGFGKPRLILPGVVALQAMNFTGYQKASDEMVSLNEQLKNEDLDLLPLIIISEDSEFLAATLNNFLWTSFTRTNPSHDIYGVNSFSEFKHWGCRGPLIFDARSKPHHAPPLLKDAATEEKIERFFIKGGSLEKFRLK